MIPNTLHATPINQQAPISASKSIIIHASPERIWSLLTDIDQWSNWYTDIQRAKLKDVVGKGARFDWKSGGVTIHSTLHTVTPMQVFGWTGTTIGLRAIHNWTLVKNNDSVTVQVEESLQGLLASLFRASFQKNLETGMQKWLEALKAEVEK